jgi:ATP-dependent exoDNAse (exonuclease V) beta subunit
MTDSGNNLYYYGDIDWKNPKISTQVSAPKSDFRIACSGLDFCGNSSISVMSSASDSESADKGTLIHHFLQKLTHFPISESERRLFVDSCPEEIRESLLALFDRTERDPQLRPYFYPDGADRVLNEASIILETGEVRRPDRIVFKPDHVMIIDYKTGREYRDKYEKQVAEYKDCLQKMGYSDVRTIILYTDENATGGNS